MSKRLYLTAIVALLLLALGIGAFHMAGERRAAEKMTGTQKGAAEMLAHGETSEAGTEQTAETEDSETETSEESKGTAGSGSGSGGGSGSGTVSHSGNSAGGSSYGALHVSGTHLADGNGNPVQLRGISTHGLAWFPEYVNEELFRQLHEEWNVNVIRLAMYTAEYGGYCSGGDQAQLKQLVKNGVQYASNQGMYAIIDWHILSDGNPNQHKKEAKGFFQEMSQTFSSYSNVLYEICNEPNGGTSWSEIKSYANEVIPVIRANDPDAVILVGTPNWSQYVDQAAADPITGYDNIMYTLHFYAATHTDALRNTMVSAINAGLPIFVSEYGICDASGNGGINEGQANQWVSVMDQYGVSYVAWSLCNKNETSAIISSSCSRTSGLTEADLSASGKWVYHMLTNGNGGMPVGGPAGGSGGSNSGGGNSGSSNSGGNSGTSAAGTVVLTNGDLEMTASVVNSWESNGQHFYQYALALKNRSSKTGTGWAIDVQFNENFNLSDHWNGNYTGNGSVLHITSMDYNGSLAPGAGTDNIGFIISGSANLAIR